MYRPAIAASAGEIVVDIWQPLTRLTERFKDGPLDLSKYECALMTCHLPRLVYEGRPFELAYKLEEDQDFSIKRWSNDDFDTLSDLCVWLTREVNPKVFNFELDSSYVYIGVKSVPPNQNGSTLVLSDESAEMFGFDKDQAFIGQDGKTWTYYQASKLNQFYTNRRRFVLLECDFVAPSPIGGTERQVLGLVPVNPFAAYGTVATNMDWEHPIWRRVVGNALEAITVTIHDPDTLLPFQWGAHVDRKTKGHVQIVFRPLAKQNFVK